LAFAVEHRPNYRPPPPPTEAGEDADLDCGGRCPSEEDAARAGTKRSLISRASGRVKRPLNTPQSTIELHARSDDL